MLNKFKKITSLGKEKENLIQSPKGMSDVQADEYYQLQGMFEKAQEVAIYYGFKPIETPVLEYEHIFTTTIGEGTDIVDKEMYTLRTKGGDHLAMRPEYTAGVMRSYIEQGMQALPQPVMLYSYGSVFRHERPQRGRLREFRQFNLEMIGSEKSITDAIIIRTVMTILEEFGFKDLTVDINSMGDKDSRVKFVRELTAYYKKHLSSICPNCKERIKTNPLRLLDCKEEACAPFKEGAPNSISFLSSDSKQHFKETLEYLEEMEIPYRINHTLARGLSYYTNTVFEVIKTETNEDGTTKEITINGGGRYDYLAKTLGSKKDIPSVGSALGFERIMLFPECKKLSPRIIKKPKVYFIQLGADAKLKSLKVVEILRKARVPIVHSLSRDTLATQLGTAEKLGIPYTIIFGQKEAVENAAIVRNMENRSQETVKIEKLQEYLKNLD